MAWTDLEARQETMTAHVATLLMQDFQERMHKRQLLGWRGVANTQHHLPMFREDSTCQQQIPPWSPPHRVPCKPDTHVHNTCNICKLLCKMEPSEANTAEQNGCQTSMLSSLAHFATCSQQGRAHVMVNKLPVQHLAHLPNILDSHNNNLDEMCFCR